MAEGHTDFILPIIGEEIGFIGILFIFILFLGFYFLNRKLFPLIILEIIKYFLILKMKYLFF